MSPITKSTEDATLSMLRENSWSSARALCASSNRPSTTRDPMATLHRSLRHHATPYRVNPSVGLCGPIGTIWRPMATLTAWAWVRTCSFSKTLILWFSTVL